MRKIITLVVIALILASLCACGSTTPTADTGTEKSEGTRTAENAEVKNDKYSIGETWTVDGQWSLTINSVTPTDQRNDFAESTPAAVYIIDYTFTNIGYKDAIGIMDGLFFGLDEGIVDATGVMGYSYPGDVTKYPKETPVGATCNAQACVGVDNSGPFEITVVQYDSNSNKQTATFSLIVE